MAIVHPNDAKIEPLIGWTTFSDFVEKVKSALLNMNDPDLLKSFPRQSFVPASNSDYSPIVDVGREIGLIE